MTIRTTRRAAHDVGSATAPLTATAANRLPTLTGLRAIAALLVFLRHVGGLLPQGPWQDQWLRVVGVGLDGVSFFFLLSGFVLAWSYRGDDTVWSFYRRRAARIGPNHLVSWLVAIPVLMLLVGARPSGRVLLSTLTLTQSWVPSETYYYGLNGVEWSLSCELLFYLLLPFMIGPLRRRAGLRWLSGATALGVVFSLPALVHPNVANVLGGGAQGWREWVLYNLPLSRLAEFVLGVVLGIAFREGWLPSISWRLGALVATVSVMASAALYSPYSVTAATLLPFATVIVAGAAADLRGAATALSSRRWVRLGEWSFAFYLVHQLVVRVVVHTFSGPPVARLLVAAPLAFAFSLALAAALYTFVERPAERRLRGRGAPAATSRVPAESPPRVEVVAVRP